MTKGQDWESKAIINWLIDWLVFKNWLFLKDTKNQILSFSYSYEVQTVQSTDTCTDWLSPGKNSERWGKGQFKGKKCRMRENEPDKSRGQGGGAEWEGGRRRNSNAGSSLQIRLICAFIQSDEQHYTEKPTLAQFLYVYAPLHSTFNLKRINYTQCQSC